MDHALNAAFFAFHTAWLLFNLMGWVWRRTRRWHLVTIGLTAISWFGFGARYGWGYCVFTDWHWQVRERLGYVNDPNSYVQLLIREMTGVDPGAAVADWLTAVLFAAAAITSVVLNLRDRHG